MTVSSGKQDVAPMNNKKKEAKGGGGVRLR